MGIFHSPGLADEDVSANAIDAWNRRIKDEFDRRPKAPFLELNPADIANGESTDAVKWPGHPLEGEECQGEEWAERLSDWGWSGRAEMHNEYLEYTLTTAIDSQGVERPKRFVATTELMEWWLTMAVHDVDSFVRKCAELSGSPQTIDDLLGVTKNQWETLSIQIRENIFRTRIVGFGRENPPKHPINQQATLFMSHGINGVDDLIYVVHFGAFPYAVRTPVGGRRKARMEEIFVAEGVTYLFCRNADPAAANGAYDQAFIDGTDDAPEGQPIAFFDPLGMYIRSFTISDIFLNGQAVPEDWVTFSRGDGNNMAQRVEFGPPDSEEIYLDDLTLGSQSGSPEVSGFQLAKRIEVGPIVVVGDQRSVTESEFKEIPEVPHRTITCGTLNDGRCQAIARFRALYEQGQIIPNGNRSN